MNDSCKNSSEELELADVTSCQGNEERFRAGGGNGLDLGEQDLRLCKREVEGKDPLQRQQAPELGH